MGPRLTCEACRRAHTPEAGCLVGVLLVCGGRTFDNFALLSATLDRLAGRMVIHAVRHGNARGADALAGRWARSRRLVEEAIPADWATHGKAAGPIRNQLMLDTDPRPVVCVGFRGGAGTRDMLIRCEAAGVLVWRVGWPQLPPTPPAE